MTTPSLVKPIVRPLARRLVNPLTQTLGGADAFLPSDLDNLDLWVDADASRVGTSGARDLTSANQEWFSVAHDAVFNSTGDRTFSAWFYFDDVPVTTAHLVVGKYGNGGVAENLKREWVIQHNLTTNYLSLYFSANGVSPGFSVQGPAITADQWVHVAWTYDGTTNEAEYYINGESQGTVTVTGGIYAGEHPLSFGCAQNLPSVPAATYFFDGALSRAGWFHHKATAAEILELFNNGNGLASGGLAGDLDANVKAYWNGNEATLDLLDSVASYDGIERVPTASSARSGPGVMGAADSTDNDNDGDLVGFTDPAGAWSTDTPDNSQERVTFDDSGNENSGLMNGFPDNPRTSDTPDGAQNRTCWDQSGNNNNGLAIGMGTDPRTSDTPNGSQEKTAFDSSGNNHHAALKNFGDDPRSTDTPDGSQQPLTLDQSGDDNHGTLKLFGDDPRSAAGTAQRKIVPDSSGNGNFGTLVNTGDDPRTTDVPTALGSGNSITLDGTDDYVAIPSMPTGSEFTFSIWFNGDTLANEPLFGAAGANYIRVLNSTTITVRLINDNDFTVPAMSTGTWYHIAVTHDASNNTRVYVDGVESTTGAVSDVGGASACVRIGSYQSVYGDGKYDDARVYPEALSAAQVAELTAGGNPTAASTPDLYLTFDESNTVTVPGQALSFPGVAGGQVNFPYIANAYGYTYSLWFKGTDTHATLVGGLGSNFYGVQIDDATTISIGSGSQETFTVPAVNDDEWHFLVAQYPTSTSCRLILDGVDYGTQVMSSASLTLDRLGDRPSSKNFNGQMADFRVHSSLLTDGQSAELAQGGNIDDEIGHVRTRYFQGVNIEYFSTPNDSDLQVNDQDFTVSVWVRPDSVPAAQVICGRDAGSSDREWLLYTGGANITWGVWNDAVGLTQIAATSALTVGEWTHFMCTGNATDHKLRIYVNGVLVNTSAAMTDFAAKATPLELANRSVDNLKFDGRLSEFGYWVGRALDADDAVALYNQGRGNKHASLSASLQTGLTEWCDLDEESGACVSAIGSSFTWTDNNTVQSTAGEVIHYDFAESNTRSIANVTASIGLTAVSDMKCEVPYQSSLDLDDTRTYAAWIKPTDVATRRAIWSERVGTTGNAIELEYGAGDGGTGRLTVTSNGSYNADTNDGVIIADKWTHVAYTRDGSTQKLYVNGVSVPLTADTPVALINQSNSRFIGDGTGGVNADGRIANVFVSDDVLTDAQIWTLANGTDVGTATVHVKFDEDNTRTHASTQSMDFDGTDDYISIPIPSTSFGAKTWIGWVNHPFDAGVIVATNATPAITNREYITLSESGGTRKLNWIMTGATSWVVELQASDDIENTWVHIAAVSDGAGNRKVYVNGVLRGEEASAATINITEVVLGAFGSKTSGWMTGNQDDIELYHSQLTHDEVLHKYTNGLLGTAPGVADGLSFDFEESNTHSLPALGAGTSLTFDGTDDRVVLGTKIQITGELTWIGWINPDAVASKVITGLHEAANDSIVYMDGNGDIIFEGETDTGSGVNFNGVTTEWTHVAITRDGSDVVRYYINSVLVGSETVTGTFGLQQIGARNSTPTLHWAGEIDGLRLYDGDTLTADEIRSLYTENARGTAPTATPVLDMQFDEDNLRDLPVLGAGGSINMDDDGHVAIPLDYDYLDDSEITISLWVKPNIAWAVSDTGLNNEWLFNIYDDASNRIGFYYDRSASTMLGLVFLTVVGGSTGQVNHSVDIPAGDYLHLVGTMASDNSVQFFVNGVLVGTATSGGDISSLVPVGQFIGNYDGSAPYYPDAVIDDVQVFKRVLSSDEVLGIYTEATRGVALTANPAAHWTLDDGPQDVGAIANEDPITSVVSREGSRIDFEQPTTAKRPKWIESAANGEPGIRFDASDDILRHVGAILTGSQGTQFIVHKAGAVGATQHIIGGADASEADHFMVNTQRVGNVMGVYHDDGGTDNNVNGDTAIADGSVYITMIQSDGATWSIRVNGNDESLTVAAGSNNGNWWGDITGLDSFSIGASYRGSAQSFADCDFLEWIEFSDVLTADEIAQVEAYLASKYGVTLS